MTIKIELENHTILEVPPGQTEKIDVPGFDGRWVVGKDEFTEAAIIAFDDRYGRTVGAGILFLNIHNPVGKLIFGRQEDDPDDRTLELDCSFEAQ